VLMISGLLAMSCTFQLRCSRPAAHTVRTAGHTQMKKTRSAGLASLR